MPELPDIACYVQALSERTVGQPLTGVRVRSIFVVRTIEPNLREAIGLHVSSVERMGKRVVIGFGPEAMYVVIHLMKSGRLLWQKPGAGIPGRRGLCAFDFETGTLLLTEAATKKRASIHVVRSRGDLDALNPDGLEIADASLETFSDALTRTAHTLKRSLTDPRIFSGIGSAYADEILHHAGLSPLAMTTRLDPDQRERLFQSAQVVLAEWTRRLLSESERAWPKVTAFRPDMAAHGRFGLPCPRCSDPIQRIVYAKTETNYCPRCQTGGRVYRDRALSRLLKDDWPSDLESLEEWSRRPGA